MKTRSIFLAVLAAALSGFLIDSVAQGQWTNHDNVTNLKLNFVAYLDNNSALICGEKGTILSTVNRGSTWDLTILGTPAELNAISIPYARDNEDFIGYVVGDAGKIYKYSKSKDWRDISVNSSIYLKSVYFRNTLHGIAVGQKYLNVMDEQLLDASASASKRPAYACILTTRDGGKTWIEKTFAVRGKFNSVVITENSRIDTEEQSGAETLGKYRAIAIGDNGLMAQSDNGGNSWILCSKQCNANLNKIEFCPFDFGVIVGDNGTLFLSKNSGATWSKVVTNRFFNIRGICSKDGLTFTAVGEAFLEVSDEIAASKPIVDGVIMESKDFGRSWSRVNVDQKGSYNYIEFCNRAWGIAVGNRGVISMYKYKKPIEDRKGELLANHTKLNGNYPNPFNPATKISYSIKNSEHVKISIFNSLGEEIANLIDKFVDAGNYEVEFNAEYLPSGIYFCRIQTSGYVQTKKMMLIR
jgi:photosystem II stability/assembly factor-like uncharacterized protein